MERKGSLIWHVVFASALAFFSLTHTDISFAQSNPCAPKASKQVPNPCAVKATKGDQNPCVAKNPCAANPCAPGAKGGATSAKAVTVTGEVAKVDPNAKKLVVKRGNGQLNLAVSAHGVIRDGAKVKSLREIKPGEKVTVSYVDTGKEQTAWYVYLASAAATANPCGGNPCAAKNPCAANPCAVKTKSAAKNPCSANPCAAKQPCAPPSTKRR